MSIEANSDGEYDYYAAEAREEAQAAAARGSGDDVEVVAILSDEEEQEQEHQEHDRCPGQEQEDEEEEEEEYEYQSALVCEREQEEMRVRSAEAAAAAASAASLGTEGEDDDNLSDMSGDYNMSQESNYEYEMSDDEAGGTAQGKNLAEADAEAFVEGSDGMFAMVEAPSSHLVRLWICVKPWRLYEGLGSRTVEALGLDPLKGVAVMLTTDQYYTLSSKCPEVKWVRQIEPDAMDTVATCSDGSIGDTFPLQWMLRKRLEEELSQNWPPRSRFPDDDDDDDGHGGVIGRHKRSGSGAASGGGAAAGSGATDPDSEAVRFAIESIREVTGVSAELAAYALRFSQYDEQLAQNNLLDEGTRASLEMTLKEDRSAAVAELKRTFPLVDEAIITRAVSTHPGALHMQRNFICRVETGEQQHPPSSASPASRVAAQQQQQQQASTSSSAGAGAAGGAGGAAGNAGATAASSGGSRFKFRNWGGLKRPSPASAGGAGSAGVDGKGGAGVDGVDARGASRSGGGRGKERAQQGWEGEGDLGYMPVDLTEDEEREDRRAMLEHLSDKNLLLRVALTAIDKLRNANKNCLVCDDKIEGFLPAVPIVCPKDLCVMSSEDMGCGTDVESQVSRKGETVDLLIDLFYMAMEGNRSELSFPDSVQYGSGLAFKGSDGKNDIGKVRRVLNIMPSVEDMQRCIERKKNGRGGGISLARSKAEVEEAGEVWNPATFVTSVSSANCPLAALNAAANAASAHANSVAATAAAAEVRDPGSAATRIARDNLVAAKLAAKNAADAATSYQASGNAGATAGGAAGAGAGNGREEADWDHPDAQVLSLREALSERDPLAYVLLRWLLSANRAHLRPLRGAELIQEIPCFKQFMLVTGTAEREARFQTMKRSAARNGGTGSFFAFHGSKPENWHGILHMGLRNMSGTKFMSAGAAYGHGIYMANQLSVSLGYANRGASGGHWPLGKTKGEAVIVAVCEVIDNEACRKEHGPSKFYVIQEEECVATRFLLINPKLSGGILSTQITAKQLAIGNQMR